MRWHLWVAFAAVVTWTACDEGEHPSDPATTAQPATPSVMPQDGLGRLLAPGQGIDYLMPTAPWFKPAYRTAAERAAEVQALKGDEFDDVRIARPEDFAITVAPTDIANIRPMVEWEPMKAIVLQWPSWYLSSQNASATVGAIARHSADYGEVWIVVNQGGQNNVRNHLLNSGMTQATVDAKVKFIAAPVESIWFIDFGPVPLINTANNTMAFGDFRYYRERPVDDGVTTILGRSMTQLGYDRPATVYRMPLSVEGGTFQATTDGVCITGSRQLVNMSIQDGQPNYNLELLPLAELQNHPLALEVKQVWRDYMGCNDVIITHSITDDGTGHIDMYLKVVDDNTVLVGAYLPPFDSDTQQAVNAERMDNNAAFIEAYVRPGGGPGFQVSRLVMPGHRSSQYGPLPFTYINSTFLNGLNLWPATEYPEWNASRAEAQATWDEVMPNHVNQYVDATELSFWSGAIHCITRTIPDLPTADWVADGTCQGGFCDAPAGAYTGACRPAQAPQDICWGPAWVCGCNDCDGPCAQPVEPCPQGLGTVGCCAGDNALNYCFDGEMRRETCQFGCGWSGGAGAYDCAGKQSNATPEAVDPSGLNPLSCKAIFCNPECAGRSCGDDGCGGTCGTCAAGETCSLDGQCGTCTDACSVGDAGCEDSVPWTCGVGAIGGHQPDVAPASADGEQVCRQGACFDKPIEPPAAQPDEGCAGGGTPGSLPWAVLIVFGLAVVRRRAIGGAGRLF